MARRTVVLVVALVLAALSAIAVWAFLDNAREEAREGLVEVPAYRAIEFVPRGALGDASLELFEESTELDGLLPVGAITSREQLEATLTGRISTGPISQGQVVTTDLWSDPSSDVVGLSELLEPGFQAISIRPDEVRSVGGFIQPGDRINVIASSEVDVSLVASALRVPAGRAVFFPGLQSRLGLTDDEMVQLADALPARVAYSQFVLQDLMVLAVGSATGPIVPDEGGEVATGQIVTLAVSAEQAEQLVFAFEYTTPWLTLVPDGFEPEATAGAEVGDIIDLPAQLVEDLRGLGFFAVPGG